MLLTFLKYCVILTLYNYICLQGDFKMYRPTNEPNYVARKSVLPAFKWWIILFFWLIIPLFILIGKIISLRCHYIEFYDNYVIEKWGVFTKHSKKNIFPKITAVTTKKNIFGFGDVDIDVVGPTWDVTFDAITHPNDLRDFLEYHMLGEAAIENISNNPYIAATDGMFN